MCHSRKYPHLPHGRNWKLNLPPLDLLIHIPIIGRDFSSLQTAEIYSVIKKKLGLFWNDPIYYIQYN
jgi:hypothetical protein